MPTPLVSAAAPGLPANSNQIRPILAFPRPNAPTPWRLSPNIIAGFVSVVDANNRLVCAAPDARTAQLIAGTVNVVFSPIGEGSR